MKNRKLIRIAAFCVLASSLGGCAMIEAQEEGGLARALGLNPGRVMSLPQIVSVGEQHSGGRVVSAELEQEDGRLVYEVEIYDQSTGLHELELDALTGAVLEED